MGRKVNFSTWIALAWIVLIVTAAAVVGALPLPAPDQMDWSHITATPGAHGHLLGTDGMGRDIASRLAFGARISLMVGAGAPGIGMALGCMLGLAAGYYRGWTERIITGGIDVLLAFPRLVLLMLVLFVFKSSLLNLTLALGIVCIPPFARVARAHTLRHAAREYVLAARASGMHDVTILTREILPNMIKPLFVYMLLAMGMVIIAEGALGFLGLSVPAPTPSWGGMIAEGREVLEQAPHVSLIPTVVMFLTILAVNVTGDRLREEYDE